jgi:hypothetical protein
MGILNRAKPSHQTEVEAHASPAVIPIEMRRAMDAVAATLDARRSVDEVIARNGADRLAAAAEHEAAAEALAELDIALALETDTAQAQALGTKTEAARKALYDAGLNMQRVDRLGLALIQKAKELDERLRHDRIAYQIEVAAYGQALLINVTAELRIAAQPLIAALAKGHAVAAGLGVLRSIRALEEVSLASPAHNEPPILQGSKFSNERGEMIDLAEAWTEIPEAAEIYEAMRPYTDLRRRLAGHHDYREPAPPAKVHERAIENSAASERARRIEIENERIRADAEAARPRARPNSWSLRRSA